jgi:2-dehydro-3-deoxyphosphogluconate aldolase / (4S)-4-hydroxy-2-oxoglutarate aldolase
MTEAHPVAHGNRGDRPVFELGSLARWGVVPLVELPSTEAAVPLARTLERAGLPCAEVALRTDAAIGGIAAIHDQCPSVILGAGTVLTLGQLDAVLRIGVDFVVTPGFNPAVVDRCLESGVAILPGIATPTEIDMALARGIDIVKVFPAAVLGGVPFLRAIAGPYRGVRFVPTGGITAGSLAEYLSVPGVLACGGSWITPPELVRHGDFAAVGRLADGALAIVRRLREPEAPRFAGADDA